MGSSSQGSQSVSDWYFYHKTHEEKQTLAANKDGYKFEIRAFWPCEKQGFVKEPWPCRRPYHQERTVKSASIYEVMYSKAFKKPCR